MAHGDGRPTEYNFRAAQLRHDGFDQARGTISSATAPAAARMTAEDQIEADLQHRARVMTRIAQRRSDAILGTSRETRIDTDIVDDAAARARADISQAWSKPDEQSAELRDDARRRPAAPKAAPITRTSGVTDGDAELDVLRARTEAARVGALGAIASSYTAAPREPA